MTETARKARSLLTMTAPIAGLSTAGMLTAAAHLKLATFALGAWTFPLAIVIPGVIAGRHIQASQPIMRTAMFAALAIILNLALDALGTAAQIRFLG